MARKKQTTKKASKQKLTHVQNTTFQLYIKVGLIVSLLIILTYLIYPEVFESIHLKNTSHTITQEITPLTNQNIDTKQPLTEPIAKVQPSISPTPTPLASPIKKIINEYTVIISILTYHYIGENPNPKDKLGERLYVTDTKFDEQLHYLAENNYQTLTLNDLYQAVVQKHQLPKKSVILTFDDGYLDFYTDAYPLLLKYNFKAVSFIPTGLMDNSYYLRWSQIQEMDKSGLVEFEAHSISHPELTKLNKDNIKFEVTTSKQILEEKLGHKVDYFAYPYGVSNATIWKIVKDAGFKAAVGTWAGKTMYGSILYDLPRISVTGNESLNQFSSRLTD